MLGMVYLYTYQISGNGVFTGIWYACKGTNGEREGTNEEEIRLQKGLLGNMGTFGERSQSGRRAGEEWEKKGERKRFHPPH